MNDLWKHFGDVCVGTTAEGLRWYRVGRSITVYAPRLANGVVAKVTHIKIDEMTIHPVPARFAA